jgi:4-amino-4-deoxy-L-arabinose transferase-like glycosyltransferase
MKTRDASPDCSLLRGWKIPSVILVLILAFFTFLGSRGLNEPDEGRYAEMGRETLVSGNWLIPHLNGFEHYQKPPMIYWVTALSFKGFGFNEWAARLPSTLAALGIVAITAWMAAMLFGTRMALPSALILASSFLFFTLARFLTPDMLMAFFIVTAISFLVKASRVDCYQHGTGFSNERSHGMGHPDLGRNSLLLWTASAWMSSSGSLDQRDTAHPDNQPILVSADDMDSP